MKRQNYLIVWSILAALILALVAIVPASADPPERYRFPLWGDGTYTCYDTELTWHEELWIQGFTACNPGSELCGATEHVFRDTFTLTNPNNGRTLILHGGQLTRVTWINWYETLIEVTGARFMGTIPGYGPVYGSPGRHVYYETCQGEDPEDWVCEQETLFDSGPTFDDPEAICNYMVNE